MFQDKHHQKKNKQLKVAIMLFASLLFVFSSIASPMLANEDAPNKPAVTQDTPKSEAMDSKDKSEVVYAKLNDTGGVCY